MAAVAPFGYGFPDGLDGDIARIGCRVGSPLYRIGADGAVEILAALGVVARPVRGSAETFVSYRYVPLPHRGFEPVVAYAFRGNDLRGYRGPDGRFWRAPIREPYDPRGMPGVGWGLRGLGTLALHAVGCGGSVFGLVDASIAKLPLDRRPDRARSAIFLNALSGGIVSDDEMEALERMRERVAARYAWSGEEVLVPARAPVWTVSCQESGLVSIDFTERTEQAATEVKAVFPAHAREEAVALGSDLVARLPGHRLYVRGWARILDPGWRPESRAPEAFVVSQAFRMKSLLRDLAPRLPREAARAAGPLIDIHHPRHGMTSDALDAAAWVEHWNRFSADLPVLPDDPAAARLRMRREAIDATLGALGLGRPRRALGVRGDPAPRTGRPRSGGGPILGRLERRILDGMGGRPPMRKSEISALLGTGRGATIRAVAGLVRKGLMRPDGTGRAFWLGRDASPR